MQSEVMEDFSFMAVYDGHGSSGKEVNNPNFLIFKASQTVNDFIQTYIDQK